MIETNGEYSLTSEFKRGKAGCLRPTIMRAISVEHTGLFVFYLFWVQGVVFTCNTVVFFNFRGVFCPLGVGNSVRPFVSPLSSSFCRKSTYRIRSFFRPPLVGFSLIVCCSCPFQDCLLAVRIVEGEDEGNRRVSRGDVQ